MLGTCNLLLYNSHKNCPNKHSTPLPNRRIETDHMEHFTFPFAAFRCPVTTF